MSEDFYRREAKTKRKLPLFRMKFDDLIEAISERASILKAQGKTSKPQTTASAAKVAAAKTGQQQYNNIVKSSPPQKQQELPVKPRCELCRMEHKTEECGRLTSLTVEKRQEELRKRALCFKCLSPGHIGKFCQNEQPTCKHCKKNHLSLLHIDYDKNVNAVKESQQPKETNKGTEAATTANPGSSA